MCEQAKLITSYSLSAWVNFELRNTFLIGNSFIRARMLCSLASIVHLCHWSLLTHHLLFGGGSINPISNIRLLGWLCRLHNSTCTASSRPWTWSVLVFDLNSVNRCVSVWLNFTINSLWFNIFIGRSIWHRIVHHFSLQDFVLLHIFIQLRIVVLMVITIDLKSRHAAVAHTPVRVFSLFVFGASVLVLFTTFFGCGFTDVLTILRLFVIITFLFVHHMVINVYSGFLTFLFSVGLDLRLFRLKCFLTFLRLSPSLNHSWIISSLKTMVCISYNGCQCQVFHSFVGLIFSILYHLVILSFQICLFIAPGPINSFLKSVFFFFFKALYQIDNSLL